MDKIDKFTKKLQHDIAVRVLEELRNIRAGNISHLNVKKLKDEGGICRVRIGKVRIKFLPTESGNMIVHIGFRNDNTY
jgi:mRNA-degrading endonuclease RelE of RelBE toxin-antitoxin system